MKNVFKRIAVPVIFCLMLIVFVSSCGGPEDINQPTATPEVTLELTPDVTPDADPGGDNQSATVLSEETATALLLHYADVMKDGYGEGHKYLHLGSMEDFREYMIGFPDKIIELIIEETLKVNDYLYEFLVLIEWNIDAAGSYIREYYYVGMVDDIPFVMMNMWGIPEDILEGFDHDKYDLYYSDHVDDTRSREHNGKQVVEHGEW